ncbi:MAG: hypothetical protein ABSB30_05090 [Terracidiphilus sp.]|jgi:hypothetical protein
MTEAIQTIPAPIEVNEPIAASANPAVARCLNAWERANKAERAKGKSKGEAHIAADDAFRDALPPLCGLENIRDFIACVTHAMIVHIFTDNTATKLLYAAQVALTTVRRQPAAPQTRRMATPLYPPGV